MNDIVNACDAWGLCSDRVVNIPYTARATGNNVMFTGSMSYIYHHNKQPLPEKTLKGMRACQVGAGLFARAPSGYWRGHYQSPDDIFGVGVHAAFFDRQLARDYIKWGYTHWGCFNNVEPSEWRTSSFFFRMPQLTAHMSLAAGLPYGPIALVVWMWSMVRSLYISKRSNDTHRKARMMYWVAKEKSWLLKPFCWMWEKRAKKLWPNGMGEIYKTWGWSEMHPCVKHLWSV
jgi:hypothetical protein